MQTMYSVATRSWLLQPDCRGSIHPSTYVQRYRVDKGPEENQDYFTIGFVESVYEMALFMQPAFVFVNIYILESLYLIYRIIEKK